VTVPPVTSDARRIGPVLVTGASGFIGRRLSETLVAGGENVVGLTRGPNPIPVSGVRTALTSDLLDRDSLRQALSGIETVVHLAARVHARPEGKQDPESECRRLNVDGTRVLLEECVAVGVTRFVFISSVKAVAEQSETALDETTRPRPSDAYGRTKLEAERLIRAVARREGIHAPILRLPLVYGPGIKSNMLRLFSAVDHGLPLPLGSVRNRRSFAHVDNVIEAIRAVLRTPEAGDETFLVSDGMDLSTPELIRRIATALGRRAHLVSVPVPVLRAVGGTGYLLSRIIRFHYTSDSLNALLGSLFVDTSKLQHMTGYSPPVSVDEGLSQTAAWLHARGAAGSR
jgi:nucleoside-diphosphate-sugar epimerase